jgi:hypothetical protein
MKEIIGEQTGYLGDLHKKYAGYETVVAAHVVWPDGSHNRWPGEGMKEPGVDGSGPRLNGWVRL